MGSPSPQALSAAERIDWLRLIRSENVGPVTFQALLRRFGSAAAALEALPDLARRGGRRGSIRVAGRAAAERELAALADCGARLVAMVEAEYPPALAAIDDAPPLIALHGHAQLAQRPCLAVVGARNASAVGVRFARDIARELGAQGLVIVSGLARGIDASAHAAALDSGTIAVLAGGIDVCYPPEHQTLYEAIAAQGLLVAELPCRTVPQARHFPRRNRLISGLSLGVLVVEAAPRSGSLITARMALEQGREVFAVPGSPLDPRARGCNDLIRHGATLVESAADVLTNLPRLRPPLADAAGRLSRGPVMAMPDDATLAAARRMVTGLLTTVPVEIDELIRQSGQSPAAVHIVLLELELAGRLLRHPGGSVAAGPPDDPRVAIV